MSRGSSVSHFEVKGPIPLAKGRGVGLVSRAPVMLVQVSY